MLSKLTTETIKQYETEPSVHVTEHVSDYDAIVMLLEEAESMALCGCEVKVWNNGRNAQAICDGSLTVFYVS